MKNIEEIRNKIEEGSLSFIVGAGFSRNISKSFPVWKDLLFPMAEELYPSCSNLHTVFEEKGYLGIASEYVRRKGYHEAIDLYIERQTPYLVEEKENSYKLYLNGKCIDSAPDIACHKALLALNAKDIYTFNYDNALDVIGQTDRAAKTQQEIDRLKHEREILQSNRTDYDDLYNSLKQNRKKAQEKLNFLPVLSFSVFPDAKHPAGGIKCRRARVPTIVFPSGIGILFVFCVCNFRNWVQG